MWSDGLRHSWGTHILSAYFSFTVHIPVRDFFVYALFLHLERHPGSVLIQKLCEIWSVLQEQNNNKKNLILEDYNKQNIWTVSVLRYQILFAFELKRLNWKYFWFLGKLEWKGLTFWRTKTENLLLSLLFLFPLLVCSTE